MGTRESLTSPVLIPNLPLPRLRPAAVPRVREEALRAPRDGGEDGGGERRRRRVPRGEGVDVEGVQVEERREERRLALVAAEAARRRARLAPRGAHRGVVADARVAPRAKLRAA